MCGSSSVQVTSVELGHLDMFNCRPRNTKRFSTLLCPLRAVECKRVRIFQPQERTQVRLSVASLLFWVLHGAGLKAHDCRFPSHWNETPVLYVHALSNKFNYAVNWKCFYYTKFSVKWCWTSCDVEGFAKGPVGALYYEKKKQHKRLVRNLKTPGADHTNHEIQHLCFVFPYFVQSSVLCAVVLLLWCVV